MEAKKRKSPGKKPGLFVFGGRDRGYFAETVTSMVAEMSVARRTGTE